MITVGSLDYTNQTITKHFELKKCTVQHPQKWENIYQMSTKYKVHISNVWTIVN